MTTAVKETNPPICLDAINYEFWKILVVLCSLNYTGGLLNALIMLCSTPWSFLKPEQQTEQRYVNFLAYSSRLKACCILVSESFSENVI